MCKTEECKINNRTYKIVSFTIYYIKRNVCLCVRVCVSFFFRVGLGRIRVSEKTRPDGSFLQTVVLYKEMVKFVLGVSKCTLCSLVPFFSQLIVNDPDHVSQNVIVRFLFCQKYILWSGTFEGWAPL